MNFLKKKVNMFGKTIPVFAFVILGLALVSAALVPYLSNAVTGNVTVNYAADVKLATLTVARAPAEYTGSTPINLGGDATGGWLNDLTLAGTHQLSTSLVAVQIINNADIALENKILKLTVSSTAGDVVCGELESLMFLDTATATQLAKNYQELKDLCVDQTDGTVVYDIPINSLASGQTYQYPVKITFGVVNPTTYTLTAQMNTGSA
jgi:hypothetical protein